MTLTIQRKYYSRARCLFWSHPTNILRFCTTVVCIFHQALGCSTWFFSHGCGCLTLFELILLFKVWLHRLFIYLNSYRIVSHMCTRDSASVRYSSVEQPLRLWDIRVLPFRQGRTVDGNDIRHGSGTFLLRAVNSENTVSAPVTVGVYIAGFSHSWMPGYLPGCNEILIDSIVSMHASQITAFETRKKLWDLLSGNVATFLGSSGV